ncbi:Prolyl oligopeptidase family protein [Chitinophaga sp. YR627]|uniref:alpha/beta hydrolase family protein n=1 Tax=Chitinophaga sp. YR627 TaxID=1881041 RepID=UPI0008E40A90|nr:prolyl oligopeptidase family serine peptidase [Chitinophaga sp. YR627]SFO26319.1 Prolyl oligopeptidase family protein [Chitinophaga sp. YR627]
MSSYKSIIFFLLIFDFCIGFTCLGQKRLIENAVYKEWNKLSDYKLSNDGRFIEYSYSNERDGATLVICYKNGRLIRSLSNVGNGKFTSNSRRFVFESENGIGIIDLENNSVKTILGAKWFAIPNDGNGNWISYFIGDTLFLAEFKDSSFKRYAGAVKSLFNPNGNAVLVEMGDSLIYKDLQKKMDKVIYRGHNDGNYIFDQSSSKLVFSVSDSIGSKIFIFRPGMEHAEVILDQESANLTKNERILPDQLSFSEKGNRLFLKFGDLEFERNDQNVQLLSSLDIWSYKDSILYSQQQYDYLREPRRTFSAVYNFSNATFIRLENKYWSLLWPPIGKYAMVVNKISNLEAYWQSDKPQLYKLISLEKGDTIYTISSAQGVYQPFISPNEKYMYWYDSSQHQYVCFDIARREGKIVSAGISSKLYNNQTNRPEKYAFGIAGWIKNDSRFLCYDEYDIWEIDPSGVVKPINITNEFGRNNKIKLRSAVPKDRLATYQDSDSLPITALDITTRKNGFTKARLGHVNKMTSIPMEECLYYFPSIYALDPPPPLKAKFADVYLLQKQSAKRPPNLVITEDFNSFISVSNIEPQVEFNWMTSELVRWKMKNGEIGVGILYKPENFDSTKKYPVIFNYYEGCSNEVFRFRYPDLSIGTLSIPWYVSNGYLVFMPDIYRETGLLGEGISNSVVSAARYLSGFRYVDSTKLGLQGHSFGGYETNYLISHCNLFAAAQPSAGISDLFGYFGGLGFGEKSLSFLLEKGIFNIGASPWASPDLYTRNSLIPYADKVKTPVLIMHNKKDGSVPFSQAVSQFIALRRNRNPTWLLQYDGEGHVLSNVENKMDFTIRQQQFFDYYLKGLPLPYWMGNSMPLNFNRVKSDF